MSIRATTGRAWPRDDDGSTELYYFSFGSAFAGAIGSVELAGVVPHLEDLFREWELERPDCEYLADTIRQYARELHPLNVERALAWLEAHKDTLPIWPPQYEEPREGYPIVRKFKSSPSGGDTEIVRVIGKIAFTQPIEDIQGSKYHTCAAGPLQSRYTLH